MQRMAKREGSIAEYVRGRGDDDAESILNDLIAAGIPTTLATIRTNKARIRKEIRVQDAKTQFDDVDRALRSLVMQNGYPLVAQRLALIINAG